MTNERHFLSENNRCVPFKLFSYRSKVSFCEFSFFVCFTCAEKILRKKEEEENFSIDTPQYLLGQPFPIDFSQLQYEIPWIYNSTKNGLIKRINLKVRLGCHISHRNTNTFASRGLTHLETPALVKIEFSEPSVYNLYYYR